MRQRKPVSLMPRLAATALLVRQQVERGAWRCNRMNAVGDQSVALELEVLFVLD
jgi:hypothetical protein